MSQFTLSPSSNCLLYMGDGWANHFTLKHYRPANRLMLEASPAGSRGAWNARVSVCSRGCGRM